MNLIFILSCLFNIQGKEPYLYDFIKKKRLWLQFRHLQTYSFKLRMMIKTTKLNILISVWMTLTFIQGHNCVRNKKLWCPCPHKFLYQSGWNSVCCHNLLVCWSSCSSYFAQVIFQGDNSADVILWNMCLTLSCAKACEPICFKLGMMLNTTKLYSLILVWMALMFARGHRAIGKVELVQSLCCKAASQMNMMVDYVRKMTVKKSCKYGEYGWFEHLLSFLSHSCKLARIWNLGLPHSRQMA